MSYPRGQTACNWSSNPWGSLGDGGQCTSESSHPGGEEAGSFTLQLPSAICHWPRASGMQKAPGQESWALTAGHGGQAQTVDAERVWVQHQQHLLQGSCLCKGPGTDPGEILVK